MSAQIVLLLGQDGLTNGAIYALLALSIMLVFTVTRVLFIPQGEFAAFSALTMAAIQAGKPAALVNITRQVGAWRGFHVSAQKDGRRPFTRTTVAEIEAGERLARHLDVPPGTRVLERARVQGVEGEPPVQTATTWVILDIVDETPRLREVDTGPGGIYSRLEEAGHRIAFEESVTCRLPRAEEQETLRIGPEQPVLTLWRRGTDENGRVVEVTHRVVVGDRHELVYRYGPGA